MVHEDNTAFLFEKQIFVSNFFEAVKELYQTLLAVRPEEFKQGDGAIVTSENQLFTFMERLMFDIIPMASENKCQGDVCKVYCSMLSLNYQETVKLIETRILKQSGDAKKDFFDSLVSNIDSGQRALNAEILLNCLN